MHPPGKEPGSIQKQIARSQLLATLAWLPIDVNRVAQHMSPSSQPDDLAAPSHRVGYCLSVKVARTDAREPLTYFSGSAFRPRSPLAVSLCGRWQPCSIRCATQYRCFLGRWRLWCTPFTKRAVIPTR
jgi:hypothetical protein